MARTGQAVALAPTDSREGVAYLQIYGPRCGLRGSRLMTLAEAQKLIGELQALVADVKARRTVCAYRDCERDARPGWTMCSRHYSAGRATIDIDA